MYRIKKDKRILQSASKIIDGLIICLNNKKFDQISVSEISLASGVSRATFYRLFDTPTDVIFYACDSIFQVDSSLVTESIKESKEEFLLTTLNFLFLNSREIELLFKSGKSYILQKKIINYLDTVSPNLFTEGLSKAEVDYVRGATIALLAGLLAVWIEHGKQEPASMLIDIYNKIISKK